MSENDSNHVAVFTVINVPVKELNNAFNTYAKITAYPMAIHIEPASGNQPRNPPAFPAFSFRVLHAFS